MCVFFPHPLVLWSSSEWRVQGCVLAVWPTPSFSLYASGSSCMGVSPALTQDFQMPDSWGTWIQPLICHLLPVLALGERPQPGQAPAQPPRCGVSESCLGLLGSLEVQTGSDRAVGKGWWGPACWGSSVAPHLWTSSHSGATFPFCPCCPFCILVTVGLVAQPCNLMETQLPSPGP